MVIVELTPSAQKEIKKRLFEHPGRGIRLGVKGGGCSGFSYHIDLGEKKVDDRVDESYGFEVYIDPKSSLYLKGSVLDYESGFLGSGFKFRNPNATNSCGCGESFSV